MSEQEKYAPMPKDNNKEPFKKKLEHLNEGELPIMVCVATFNEIAIFPEERRRSLNVKFSEYDAKKQERQGIESDGEETYVISPVNKRDKFSSCFYDCTGIIAVGRDLATNKDISFLTHQSPDYFLDTTRLEEGRNKFIPDLNSRLKELRERCVPGTIDAVIIGGNFVRRSNYIYSVSVLGEAVKYVLGFEPVVIIGPKTGNHVYDPNADDILARRYDEIFFKTNKRRLYIIRPAVGDATTESFLPSAVREQIRKIDSEQNSHQRNTSNPRE